MNLPAGATASNIRFLSRNDQGGRPDGVQVILHKGHAFIGHMFSDGYSVVDVRDPLKPKTVATTCKFTTTSCSPSTGRTSGPCSSTRRSRITTRSR
jgi:hypothetical protein